jgi:Tfp pilus assembly protein PilW
MSASCKLQAASCTHGAARRGVTLLETVVWIAVLVMVLFAIVTAIVTFYRANRFTLAQATAVASAQRGIDLTVQTVREAGFSSNGAYPVISIAPNQFSFYADVDSDPQIEQVRFFLEGTALKEGVINPTGDPPAYTGTETISIVSDNVQNLATNVTTFQYYDANGAEITDYTRFGSVRSVTIHILVDNDLKQPPAALELRSSATLRNLR